HMSLVQGEENVQFLKKRFEVLSQNPLFQGMEFSDDPKKLSEWIPLIMDGRTSNEPIAATKNDAGTDVNFGALTRILFDQLEDQTDKFVFIAVRAVSLALLLKTGIVESELIGGFPVRGMFFICNNSELVEQHETTV